MTNLVNVLDAITEGRDLPAGYDAWALKTVRADFRTRDDYRWPFPGGETEVHALDPENRGSCPAYEGDGICVATTWEGMASAGIPARSVLLVAYRKAEAEGHESGKLRVPQAFVVDLFDGDQLVRDYGRGANLARAHLRGANLWGANLWGANLRGANLRGANLRGADLRGANLRGANLWDADLYFADLTGADLTGANLRGADRDADLWAANLQDVDLRDANLQGACLKDANLQDVDLRDANLRDVDLRGANLRYVDLRGADLRGASLWDTFQVGVKLPEDLEKQVAQND